jgi:uncharacterized protein (TIGR02246 family)
MSDDADPVSRALDAYALAVYGKNLEAFTDLYADDVHVFDAWGQWEYRGIDAWREMASGWFRSLGDERVEVYVNDVGSWVGDDVAVGHAAVTFTAITPDGEQLRSTTNRLTVGLEKRNGDWKIVHEHTSLPIDMATGKATFPA